MPGAGRKVEKPYRFIIDKISDSIVVTSRDGTVLFVNPAAAELFGRSREELLGQFIGLPALSNDLTEINPVRKDQKVIFAELRVVEAEWEGQPAYVFSLRDVTLRHEAASERARHAEQLALSEQRLAAIIGSAMDGIITLGADLRIRVFNATAEKVFCCPAAEAIGQPLDRFIPSELREIHPHHIEFFGATKVASRPMQGPGGLFGVRANGQKFPLEATISQVTVGGEKLYTVILRDITQRLQTEDALIQSEKIASLGRLLSTIAHELNNPLEAVMNLLYLAQSSVSLEPATREYLTTALAELSRAAQISKQTLGFSRGGTKRTRFRLTQVLDNLWALLDRNFQKEMVVCEKEFRGHTDMWAVENEIRQVFWNLLTNSLQSTPRGGRVRLRVSPVSFCPGGPRIRITIADNGHGISADHRPRLFQPFFTTKETGNGLGLWVVSEVVKRHGGSIRVRSRTEPVSQRGTVFSVFLPTGLQERGKAE